MQENVVARLIAWAGHPFDRPSLEAIEDLDREIAAIRMQSFPEEVGRTEPVAILVAAYERLLMRTHRPRIRHEREHAFVAMLAQLPADVQRLVADLAADRPLRRALTTGDDPATYLDAQIGDGWMILRAGLHRDKAPGFADLIASLDPRPVRRRLSAAKVALLARQVSHAFHGGARPDDDAPYYVRTIETDDEALPVQIHVVIDRASNAEIDSFTQWESAAGFAERLGRNPEIAKAYVQVSALKAYLDDRDQPESVRQVGRSGRPSGTSCTSTTRPESLNPVIRGRQRDEQPHHIRHTRSGDARRRPDRALGQRQARSGPPGLDRLRGLRRVRMGLPRRLPGRGPRPDAHPQRPLQQSRGAQVPARRLRPEDLRPDVEPMTKAEIEACRKERSQAYSKSKGWR